jgi:hypothetical protein
MHAQQTDGRWFTLPFGALQQLREARSNIAPLVRETRERDRRAAYLDGKGSRSIEYMYVAMQYEALMRQT